MVIPYGTARTPTFIKYAAVYRVDLASLHYSYSICNSVRHNLNISWWHPRANVHALQPFSIQPTEYIHIRCSVQRWVFPTMTSKKKKKIIVWVSVSTKYYTALSYQFYATNELNSIMIFQIHIYTIADNSPVNTEYDKISTATMPTMRFLLATHLFWNLNRRNKMVSDNGQQRQRQQQFGNLYNLETIFYFIHTTAIQFIWPTASPKWHMLHGTFLVVRVQWMVSTIHIDTIVLYVSHAVDCFWCSFVTNSAWKWHLAFDK